MGLMFELTTLGVNGTYTGSMIGNANTSGASIVFLGPDTVQTGSWEGLGNTWGGSENILTLGQNTQTGSWPGSAYTWGVKFIVTESYDRFDVTSNEYPIVNQSVGPGEWDPFPIPEAPPEPELPQRDVTRYRKTYSSQRHQVQRIRIVRK